MLISTEQIIDKDHSELLCFCFDTSRLRLISEKTMPSESGEVSTVDDSQQFDNPNKMMPQKSSQSGDSQPPVSVNINYDDLRNAILSFANVYTKKPPAGKSGQAKITFVADDEIIRDVKQRVEEKIEKHEVFPGFETIFSATVKMPDGTEQRFDDFERCLKRAADRADPRSLVLCWEKKLRDPVASNVRIEAIFDTGGPFLKYKNADASAISLEINGPDDLFVEQSFDAVYPAMKIAEVRGLYQPLMPLKQQIFRGWGAALSIGAIAAYPLYTFLSRQTEIEYAAKAKKLEAIHSALNIDAKIDLIAKHLINPEGLPGWVFIASLGMMFVLFGSWIALQSALVWLVPRSCIAIGLAKKRYVQYENAFRFIVFSLLVGGIVSGLILPFIRYIASS